MAVSILCIATSWEYSWGTYAVVGVVLGGGSILFHDRASQIIQKMTWVRCAVLLLCFLFWMSGLEGTKRKLTDSRVYRKGDGTRHFDNAWKAPDMLPSGSVITWFGSKIHPYKTYCYYVMFGRRYHLRPLSVDRTGRPLRSIHDLSREGEIEWWGPAGGHGDQEDFSINLSQAKVDYVLVTKSDGETWPVQQNWLSELKATTQVYNDGKAVIWKWNRIGAERGQASHAVSCRP